MKDGLSGSCLALSTSIMSPLCANVDLGVFFPRSVVFFLRCYVLGHLIASTYMALVWIEAQVSGPVERVDLSYMRTIGARLLNQCGAHVNRFR